MPDDSKRDYITKTEAAGTYRRSERSLSRDITNAIKFTDEVVLANVELRLEDGTRRPGAELTIREIVELRDRGLNPTWLLDTRWLKQAYGRRDEPPPHGTSVESRQPVVESAPVSSALPDDPSQRAAILAAQNAALERMNADLKGQAVRLEKELDRRAEERREENELQKQNNVLMQQIYNLLSKMQEAPGQVSILPAPEPGPRSGRGESVIAVDGQLMPEPRATSPAAKGATRRPSRKRARRTKPVPAKEQKPDAAMKKYLPTLDRAVRFFSRK